MSAGTLIVKISANITDFSKGLDAAEKRLMKAGDKLEGLGRDLSMRVTAPLIAAGALFAKSAADDAASVEKMGRAFGRAQGDMEDFIQQLMKSVPETDDAMRELVSSTDTLLTQMGVAPQKATAMTKTLATLAGDMAAFKHVSMEVAEDALEKAMMGKTRGLAQFGIAVSEADVKQKAYAMGLAKVGSDLSASVTAQAALAAVLERSSKIQGEAQRTFNDDANAVARLKQAADGVADSFGAVVLPTFVKITNAAKDMADAMTGLDPSTKGLIVGFAAAAAAAGPLLYVGGSVVKVFTLARAALLGLVATEALSGLGALVMGITSVSEASTVAAIAGGALVTALSPLLIAGGITAAIVGIGYLFYKSGEEARNAARDVDAFTASLAKLTTVQESQALAKATAAKLALIPAAPVRGFGNGVAAGLGYAMPGLAGHFMTEDSNATQRRMLQQELIAANNRTRELAAPDGPPVHAGGGGGGGGGGTGTTNPYADLEARASQLSRVYALTTAQGRPLAGLNEQITGTIDALNAALGTQKDQWGDVALRIREAADALGRYGSATMANGLTRPQLTAKLSNIQTQGTPAPIASITAANLPASLTTTLGQPLIKLVSLQDRMVAALNTLPEAFASTLGQYLGPVLAKMGGGVGGAIGGSLGGSVGGAMGKAVAENMIAKGMGKLAGAAVGSVVPVVGTMLGAGVGSLIGGTLGKLFGGGSGPSAADRAAQKLEMLAIAAQKVQEAISGLPEGIKVATYRFAATAPVPVTPGAAPAGPSNPSGPLGGGGRTDSAGIHINGPIYVTGVQNIRELYQQITELALSQAARGGVTSLQLAAGRA